MADAADAGDAPPRDDIALPITLTHTYTHPHTPPAVPRAA